MKTSFKFIRVSRHWFPRGGLKNSGKELLKGNDNNIKPERMHYWYFKKWVDWNLSFKSQGKITYI